MAQTTGNDQGRERGDLAAAAVERGREQLSAAVERGREQLDSAKGQLADGAERVADAVERTAEELDGEGPGAISGFGHSVASLTRQLAGGLRERDVEEFARELSSLARRNPGVFLAGSVALGFGIARFFKARPSSAAASGAEWDSATSSSAGWDSRERGVPSDAWHDGDQQFVGAQPEFDAEDGLDLSGGRTTEWQERDRGTDLPQSAAPSDGSDSQLARSGKESPAATTAPDLTSGGKA